MAPTRRNDPCPCGSGKKVKHCCGERVRRYSPSPGTPLHLLDERLVDDMMAFALNRFGRQWFDDACQEYFLEPEQEAERDQLQLFIPWAVYHRNTQGRTVREWFLAERGDRLTEAERVWLLAQAPAVVTLWEVSEVRPGEGITMTDLLGGETHFIHEVKGSRTLRAWNTVLGRVVSQGGISVICGMYPRTLPPRESDEVHREIRRHLHVRDGRVSHDKLAREDVTLELIHLWMEAVLDLECRPFVMPQLTNTDGDPLLPIEEVFSFAPEARAQVLEALLRMEDVEVEDEGIPARLTFLRPGNAMHPSWENTLVGSAQVEAARLRLETNSPRRADALRAHVEAACPGLLKFQTREQIDPKALLASAGASKPRDRPEPTPEMAAALREFKAQHYAHWADTALPALKGKTPRQAMRTKAGRREVALLLKELEFHESMGPEQERVDFSALRGELGLST